MATMSSPTARSCKDIQGVSMQFCDSSKERMFMDVVSSRDGCILALDSETNEVCTFNRNGKLVNVVALQLSPSGILAANHVSMVELSDGNWVVSDTISHCLFVYKPNGQFVKKFGEAYSSHTPYGLAVSNKGTLFVAFLDCRQILTFNDSYEMVTSFNLDEFQGLYSFSRMCIGKDEHVYVTEYESHVLSFQQDGQFLTLFGEAQLNYPTGIASTSDGHLVVASSTFPKLSFFATTGECIHEVADDSLKNPGGIAVNNDGTIYIADGSRILVF